MVAFAADAGAFAPLSCENVGVAGVGVASAQIRLLRPGRHGVVRVTLCHGSGPGPSAPSIQCAASRRGIGRITPAPSTTSLFSGANCDSMLATSALASGELDQVLVCTPYTTGTVRGPTISLAHAPEAVIGQRRFCPPSHRPGCEGLLVASPDRSNALDHVVVVMFENRSFDNLLGRLYEPGEVESFEGVIGKDLSNPIPEWAEHGADRGVVPYGVSPTMNTPWPDPGEELPHINTQLFGILDEGNRGVLAAGEDVQRAGLPEPAADDGRVPHRLHQHVRRRVRPATNL